MFCPYNSKIACEYLNTSGMDQEKECRTCPHYKEPDEKGIIATGAMPILGRIVEFFRSRKIGKKNRVRIDPKMYSCTCEHCGKIFSSSILGFTCCPICYI